MIWKPHVVVASVVERDGRFLLVEEKIKGHMVLNQPAGHLEHGESLLDAVRRETLEETCYRFEPTAWLGATLMHTDDPSRVFLRFTFIGNLLGEVPAAQRDPDIFGVHWLTEQEIRTHPRLAPRSEMVLRSIASYHSGVRLPLDTLDHIGFSPE